MGVIRSNNEIANSLYIYYLLRSQKFNDYLRQAISGANINNLNGSILGNYQIPLPPLEIQEKIVAEIDGYQKIMDGARQIVENYKPSIKINPTWPMIALAEICENLDGKRIPITESDRKSGPYPYYGASGIVDHVAEYIFDEELLLVSEDGANLLARVTPIAFSVSGKCWVNNHAHVLRFAQRATQYFVEYYLNSIQLDHFVTGSAQPKLNQANLNAIPIPNPPLDEQKRIVEQIESEQKIVNENKKIIEIFKNKISDTIGAL
jgi:restriction endonuclease S subunit